MLCCVVFFIHLLVLVLLCNLQNSIGLPSLYRSAQVNYKYLNCNHITQSGNNWQTLCQFNNLPAVQSHSNTGVVYARQLRPLIPHWTVNLHSKSSLYNLLTTNTWYWTFASIQSANISKLILAATRFFGYKEHQVSTILESTCLFLKQT